MLVGRSLDEFRAQPEGGYVAGRSWLYFGIKLFDEIAFPFATDERNANVLVSFSEKDDDSIVSRVILDRIGGADMPSRWWAQGTNSANPPPHSVNLQWIGAPSITARIQAFRYTVDPVTKGPKHYVGYDSADLTLVDGPPTTFAVSRKPPPFGESTISLTLNRSPGQDSVTAYLGLQAGTPTWVQPFASIVTKASEVSFVVPDLPGAPFSAMAEATNLSSVTAANVPGLAAGAKGVILDIPPSLELIGLKDGDHFGVGSTFQWSSQGTDASFVQLTTSPGDNNGSVMSYFVATQGDSMVVPDLGKLGIDLPPGVDYSTVVQRYSTNPTVDDLAADPMAHQQLSAPSRYATSAMLGLTSQ